MAHGPLVYLNQITQAINAILNFSQLIETPEYYQIVIQTNLQKCKDASIWIKFMDGSSYWKMTNFSEVCLLSLINISENFEVAR